MSSIWSGDSNTIFGFCLSGGTAVDNFFFLIFFCAELLVNTWTLFNYRERVGNLVFMWYFECCTVPRFVVFWWDAVQLKPTGIIASSKNTLWYLKRYLSVRLGLGNLQLMRIRSSLYFWDLSLWIWLLPLNLVVDTNTVLIKISLHVCVSAVCMFARTCVNIVNPFPMHYISVFTCVAVRKCTLRWRIMLERVIIGWL